METAIRGEYTRPHRQMYNCNYKNTKGNRVFVCEDNWLVYADRSLGPQRTQFYFSGQLFVDGELVDAEYEISEAQLKRWFPIEVGA